MSERRPAPFRSTFLLPGMAALLLSTVPLVAAWLATPPAAHFMGAVFNTGDASAYLAGIRQGAAGAFRYTIPFTPEQVTPRVMYTLYLALGGWTAMVGGGAMLWWHVARLGAALFALTAVAFLVRSLVPKDIVWQRSAYFLVLFGGGVGWLARLAARFLPLSSSWWPDVNLTEWSPIFIIANPPHFALGLGLTAVLMAAVVQQERGFKIRPLFLAMPAAVLLGLIYPYGVPLAGAILAGYAVTETAVRRRLHRPLLITLLPIAALFAAFGFYYGLWLPADPLWARLNVTQNGVPAPPLPGILLGLGALGGLALLGLRPWLSRGCSRLVPVWAGVQLLLFAAPLPYAGRFAFGVTVPVALLAATGLERVLLPALGRRERWRPLLLLALVPSVVLGLILETRTAVRTTDWPVYAPAGELAAMHWLADQSTEEDLIFAYHQIGNWLPRFAPGRVFVGQKFATIDPDGKAAQVVSFWHEGAPPGWRERLLAEWEVDWIYYGRYERAITAGVVEPPGQLVYDRLGVEIYRVTP